MFSVCPFFSEKEIHIVQHHLKAVGVLSGTLSAGALVAVPVLFPACCAAIDRHSSQIDQVVMEGKTPLPEGFVDAWKANRQEKLGLSGVEEEPSAGTAGAPPPTRQGTGGMGKAVLDQYFLTKYGHNCLSGMFRYALRFVWDRVKDVLAKEGVTLLVCFAANLCLKRCSFCRPWLDTPALQSQFRGSFVEANAFMMSTAMGWACYGPFKRWPVLLRLLRPHYCASFLPSDRLIELQGTLSAKDVAVFHVVTSVAPSLVRVLTQLLLSKQKEESPMEAVQSKRLPKFLQRYQKGYLSVAGLHLVLGLWSTLCVYGFSRYGESPQGQDLSSPFNRMFVGKLFNTSRGTPFIYGLIGFYVGMYYE